MNLSYVEKRSNVSFPEFKNEKVYMVPFYKKEGLPFNLKHWQKTVDAMLEGVETENVIYLMVDQGIVRANTFHRRPGVHIDGYWNPNFNGHGGHRIEMEGSHGGHKITMSGHSHNTGSHSVTNDISKTNNGNHVVNSGVHIITPENIGEHQHISNDGGHIVRPKKKMDTSINYWEPEGLILASNLTAARAWNGYYVGMPKEGGDCSHINLDNLEQVDMEQNYVYCGNVTMLHESLIIKEDTLRTVVRLNVPNWTPEKLH